MSNGKFTAQDVAQLERDVANWATKYAVKAGLVPTPDPKDVWYEARCEKCVWSQMGDTSTQAQRAGEKHIRENHARGDVPVFGLYRCVR